jgi:hypothetical protein
VVTCFETLMGVKTIHKPTRNVISCSFRVISWIVFAQGKTTRNQTRALPEIGRPGEPSLPSISSHSGNS